METEFSPDIIKMLSRARFDLIVERLTAIRECVASAPNRTSWVRHIPISLTSSDPIAAEDELIAHLSKSGPDWAFAICRGVNGAHLGFASDSYRPSKTHSDSKVYQLLLFDLHSGLVGWWLSHLWRAADFAEATFVSLADWLILPASACARALLEGVAAFTIEGEQLLFEWSEFKKRGVPEPRAIMEFREQFLLKLTQAQFGTRIGERAGTTRPLMKRTNVLTLLEKFAKRVDGDVMVSYEWLCDAVHPSFGFQTVYTATHGVHKARTTIAADLAKRTDKALTLSPKIDPTVAWACVDVFNVSLDAMLAEVQRIRWLIDDFGLTTGITFTGLENSLGKISEKSKTETCLCGSGLSFEDCTHKWGIPSIPPDINKK